LLVLTAAVTSTREERKREFAIMRALGATGRLLSQVQTAELMGVGLMAGFLASMVAELVGWGLARFVFEFEWNASLWVPVAGALTGAVLAWVAGWWGLAGLTFLYGTAFTIMFTVLPKLGVVGNSAIMNVEPIFALVLAWGLLGQAIAPMQLVGAAVVVSTVMWLGLRKPKP
jgi:drug/metabolite transporter (DMT)-like permease